VAMLVPIGSQAKVRKPGTGKGQVLYVAPDFDKTPEDLADYT
jgi:hypothetical protein